MKVLIAAGGTGGHIYPALALAEILQQEQKDAEIVFWGSETRMESTLIPEKGYRFYGSKMTGMNGGFKNKVKSAVSLLQAEKYAGAVLKKEKPDIVVGFGNYISVPIVRRAHAMHIPVMLHEQNSYAGKANRFLAPKADAIAVCYAENKKQMPKAADKIRVLGNPEATLASHTVFHPEDLKACGLDPAKPFAVFMMGSLGSSSVSRVIDEASDMFAPDFQVLIAAGRANDYTYSHHGNGHTAVVPYINGREMLKGCSLAVVRAGATTMSELTAIGTASILIPSPYVPNNHQYYNAMELVRAGAAEMIEEKDLNAAVLAEKVNALMHAPEKTEEMRRNALKIGMPNAAYDMIHWMEELTGNA